MKTLLSLFILAGLLSFAPAGAEEPQTMAQATASLKKLVAKKTLTVEDHIAALEAIFAIELLISEKDVVVDVKEPKSEDAADPAKPAKSKAPAKTAKRNTKKGN